MDLPSDSIDLLADFADERVEYLLGRAELVRLERASGRPRDLLDADALERAG